MLKEKVTYVDYDGNERTEELHFNLTQTELVELSMELPPESSAIIGDNPKNISEETAVKLLEQMGGKEILAFIKKLILKSYGVKSEDGRLFKKSEELTTEFSQTLAFDKLIVDMMSDDKKASDFINRVIPAKLVEKALADGVPSLPANN